MAIVRILRMLHPGARSGSGDSEEECCPFHSRIARIRSCVRNLTLRPCVRNFKVLGRVGGSAQALLLLARPSPNLGLPLHVVRG